MDREEDEPLGPGFAVYHFEGLGHVKDIRRLIEIAVYDTLGMENSLQRPRTLAYLAQTAEDLLARYNDQLDSLVRQREDQGKRGPKLPTQIEWATLAEEMQGQVDARVKLLVDLARAAACEMMGETRRALAFRERHQ